MINSSKVISSIKMDLGLYGLSLPFGNIDDIIMDVIREKTLPVFNEFYPNVVTVPLNLQHEECIKRSYDESIFIIPDIFGEREIINVRDVRYTLGGSYLSSAGFSDVQNIMLGQVSANILSGIEPPKTFNFTHPNRLHLYNIDSTYGTIEVELGIEHAENLSTIPKSAYTFFLKVATLDVKIFLYNQLKHYNEIQTAHGTINLRIDDWADAKSERQDVMNQWEERFHFDTPQIFII